MNHVAPIEVFVLTYNRAVLLGDTLRSIAGQSVRPCRVRVLDNGSTDATAEVVQRRERDGIELIHWPTNDPRGCWARMQTMIEAPWAMLFHDDDLLHPDCIRRVMETIDQVRDISIVLTLMKPFRGTVPEFPKPAASAPSRLSAAKLAGRLYRGQHVPFCTAVYRRDALQRCEVKIGTYGKMFDRPLMIDVAAIDAAALIPEPLVLYRLHASQDSTHRVSGPLPREVIALQAMYRRLLGESPLFSAGRSFLRRNWRNLTEEHARMQGSPGWDISVNQFLGDAVVGGGASRWSLTAGRIYAVVTSLPRRIERWIRRFRTRGS